MTFGLQADEATSHTILDTAFDAGVTFIDTADFYPLGQSGDVAGRTEEVVGRWLKGKRDDVVLASKFFFPMGSNPWDKGGGRRHVLSAVDATLRRLNTDYLDLYQIHAFDDRTPIDETLLALEDLVRIGKVHYLGCSNYAAWQLSRALGRSETLGISRYESVQPRYNLLFRNIERDILPAAQHDDVAVIPYNPLAGGMLTGKHRGQSEPPTGGRFTLGTSAEMYRGRYWAQDKFAVVDEIAGLARNAGLSMTTLSLAWVMANPGITAPIIGASKPEQLADSLAAVDAVLDADLLTKLNELTHGYRTVDADR